MHSIRAYSIRVKIPREEEYVSLTAINGRDLLDIFHDALQALEANFETCIEARVQKVFKVEQLQVDGRYISGLLQCGNYGYSSKILDTASNTTTYEKTMEEAETIPLYFLLYIGQGSHGFAIFQKHGLNGIKGYLSRKLLEAFQASTSSHVLQIAQVLDEDALNELLDQGEIKKIRFINFAPPEDIADAVNEICTEDEEGEIEIQIRPKRKGRLSNAKRELEKFLGHASTGVFATLGDQYEKLKVEVEIDGKKRTVNFSNPSDFHMDMDITDEVDMQQGGHPDFDELDDLAKSVVRDLLEKLAGTHEQQG